MLKTLENILNSQYLGQLDSFFIILKLYFNKSTVF